MHLISAAVGGLECRVLDVEGGSPPELAVVLCHGYGAPGDDLVGLASEVLRLQPNLMGRVRFYFPAAPLKLQGFGWSESRAWWHIDMEKLEAAMISGDLRDMRSEEPEGLPEARRLFMGTLNEILGQTGLPWSRLVLGGFSQGAMLATDATLRLEEAPAALAVMSGTLLMENQWRPLAQKRAGLKVLQSHGRQDPLLPFASAEWLKDLLMDSGLEVEFLPFDNAHTIPAEVVARLAALVKDACDGG